MTVAADASGLFWEVDEEPKASAAPTTGGDKQEPMQAVPAWAWVALWLCFDLGAAMVAGVLLSASGG